MNKKQLQLEQELRQAGASPSEINELTSVALKLELLKTARKRKLIWTTVLKPVALAASGLALSGIIVMVAQSAIPTSLLYPVQKLSDAIVVDIDPGYRATVMMRRAQQVDELVAHHASPYVILATLGSYDSEAATYKDTMHDNYAAFDYCKSSLEQAATAAPQRVREAIIHSIDNIDAT